MLNHHLKAPEFRNFKAVPHLNIQGVKVINYGNQVTGYCLMGETLNYKIAQNGCYG